MRFLPDPGSGTCLWRQDRVEEAHLGYAIDHHALSLTKNLQSALDALIALTDLRIDWDDPTSEGPYWTRPTSHVFEDLQARAVSALRLELKGLGFTLATEG